MRNDVPASEVTPSVSAETENGTAEFHRSGPGSAKLQLEYYVTGLQAALADNADPSLAQGVAAICDDEIAAMRTSLRELGDNLADQLSDEGKAPVIRQDSDDHDTRNWTDSGTEFFVAPSVYHSETVLTGYKGAADAELVRQAVETAIQHRENSIRELYRQVAEDATAKRSQTTPATPQTVS